MKNIIKLNGKKLYKSDTNPIYDILKIQYIPNEKLYRIIHKNKSYLLSKESNFLIWNIPQNLIGSNLDIRIQAFDENNGKSLYVTNNILVKSSPYQFDNVNNSSYTSINTNVQSISPITNIVDSYSSNYPTYLMSDEHPVIHIVNRKINVPTDYPIVVSQDNVSQLLTFDMNRFYDGVDLNEKACTIQYINASGISGEAMAVNVFSDEQRIIFGWLLDNNVTESAGKVQFKIVFKGMNEYDQLYIWQSLDASLPVEKSIWIIDTEAEERYPSIIEDLLIRIKAIEKKIGGVEDPEVGSWINIDDM